jgi:hypothetical protein
MTSLEFHFDFIWRIYTAFDANLTEAPEAVVGSGATFRLELADNLNFRHLAKIESIADCAGKPGCKATWSMNSKFCGQRPCRGNRNFTMPAKSGRGTRANGAIGRGAPPP